MAVRNGSRRVTLDKAMGVESSFRACVGRMLNPGLTDICAPVHHWETFVFTKEGNQKMVKDIEELTKMVGHSCWLPEQVGFWKVSCCCFCF